MRAPGVFWQEAERALVGRLGHSIIHEAVDCNARRDECDGSAIRWLGSDCEKRSISGRELSLSSNRLAHALRVFGFGRLDKLFTFLGRVPELDVTAICTWKCSALFGPLLSAFDSEPELTQRFKALCDLAAQEGAPCADMFELQRKPGQAKLRQAYAASLASWQ
jgi:hypothetical protein